MRRKPHSVLIRFIYIKITVKKSEKEYSASQKAEAQN